MKTKILDAKGKKRKTEDAQLPEARSISAAWHPFSQRLAAVLESLGEDDVLIVSLKSSNLFVQFAAQGFYGMRLETISNWYRDEKNQLSDDQIANLVDIGWTAPTMNPEQSMPQGDPDGSSNFFREFPVPFRSMEMADMAVRTLVEVLAVAHPGFLKYNAFKIDGNSIPLPKLGLAREITDEDHEKNQAEILPKLLLETVIELTGIDDWTYDDDGDLGAIRYGNTVTYAQLPDDRPYVHFHATVLRDVEETHALFVRVNALNRQNGHLHLCIRDNSVIAFSDVLITPFVSSIVAHGLSNFCQVADELGDILRAEFGEDGVTIEQQPQQLVH